MAESERVRARRELAFALDLAMQMFRQGIETEVIVRTVRRLARAGGIDDLRISVGDRAIHLQFGVLAGTAARTLRVPTAVITIPGLTGAVLPGPAMYLSLSQVFAQLPGSWNAVAEAVVSTAAIGVGVVLGLQVAALRRAS